MPESSLVAGSTVSRMSGRSPSKSINNVGLAGLGAGGRAELKRAAELGDRGRRIRGRQQVQQHGHRRAGWARRRGSPRSGPSRKVSRLISRARGSSCTSFNGTTMVVKVLPSLVSRT